MAKFWYPVIDGNNVFLGTGLFFSSLPEQMRTKETFQKINKNISGYEDVMIALEKLSEKSFDSPKGLFQNKGDHLIYQGESMLLALLLAGINRAKDVIWNSSIDIWATGNIKISGNFPVLRFVSPQEFNAKIEAFSKQNEVSIFIIPYNNYSPDDHDGLIEKYNINVLSLKQFKRLSLKNTLNEKIIIRVKEHELPLLKKTIFVHSINEKLMDKKMHLSVFAFFLLIIIISGALYLNQQWRNHALNNEVKSLCPAMNSYFTQTTPPCILTKEEVPANIKRNQTIEYAGACILTNNRDIVGKIAFYYPFSGQYIVWDCNSKNLQTISNIDLNDFFVYQYDINDLNTRIFLERFRRKESYADNDQIEIIQGTNEISFSHNKSETVFLLNKASSKVTSPKIQNIKDNILEMPFVWIKGGCFESPEEEKILCVNGFWMSQHEVTLKQWKKIMNSTPSFFNKFGDHKPVESATWQEVNQFINRLNDLQMPTCSLPTAKEWDYAYYSSHSKNDSCAAGGDSTYTVCYHGKDQSGLCDMNGNVMEWCQTDGQTDMPEKPVKGCSWSSPEMMRQGYTYPFDKSKCDLGFRLVWRKQKYAAE